MALTVPRPKVTVEGISGTQFVAEKPMNLTCGAVIFPDGSELAPEQAEQFVFRLYRKLSNGNQEAWDPSNEGWVSESAAPEPEPLAFMDGVWQNVMVAMGQQDHAGLDKFATDRSSSFPKYHVRCLFGAVDAAGAQHEGTSPASTEFTVYAAGALDRAGLAMAPPDLAEAEEIRLFLKDEGLVAERGMIAIRGHSGIFEIELRVGGASVWLNNSGDIQLSPASGRSVVVEGDVTVSGSLQVDGQNVMLEP